MLDKKNTFLLFYKDNSQDNVSIEKYEKWLETSDREHISNFIVARLQRRYIRPFNCLFYKNGFAMMGCASLLIETLQCFREGRPDSENIDGVKLFTNFFTDSKTKLNDFKSIHFYKHIRCGILHQGETTGGFKIRRDGELYNSGEKIINATKFLKELNQDVINYGEQLKSEKMCHPLWVNFMKKMYAIIDNCAIQ